ncbi:MAG: sialate O-acetylesterase [Planctomycetota bacterium]|nr:sialate O-acetylesterase [Planctomycetota bacterium]
MNHATNCSLRGILTALIGCLLVFPATAQTPKKPLKVYILAGQSNMEGHAKLSSFDHIAMDPKTAPLLAAMRDANGQPTICDDVWISYYTGAGEGGEGHGNLTAGYGARSDPTRDGGKIGPEFTFGIYLHQRLQEPILIIKTAWGGKSLHTDFRSPSAGPYQFTEKQLAYFQEKKKDLQQIRTDKEKATGQYYHKMLKHVRHVLQDIPRVCPAYDPDQGYELAGFVWFQGWNDMVDQGTYPNRGQPGGYDAYSNALAHFIRDVRQDLNAPQMRFVIGVMGAGGPVARYGKNRIRYKDIHQGFRDAMAAPASLPEFQDNVVTVLTENYWDPELDAVSDKLEQVKAKARELKLANEGYPNKPGTISPQEQNEMVSRWREELLTPRDHELLKGITNAEYHYRGSAKIMAQIGKAFAEAVAPESSQ